MGDPQSGSLGLSVVANPSPCCQPNTFVLPGVEPAKDTPEFGFFQPRLPVAPGELPALGLGGGGSVIPVSLSWARVVPNAL